MFILTLCLISIHACLKEFEEACYRYLHENSKDRIYELFKGLSIDKVRRVFPMFDYKVIYLMNMALVVFVQVCTQVIPVAQLQTFGKNY